MLAHLSRTTLENQTIIGLMQCSPTIFSAQIILNYNGAQIIDNKLSEKCEIIRWEFIVQ